MIVDSLESWTLSNTKYQKSLGKFKKRRKQRERQNKKGRIKGQTLVTCDQQIFLKWWAVMDFSTTTQNYSTQMNIERWPQRNKIKTIIGFQFRDKGAFPDASSGTKSTCQCRRCKKWWLQGQKSLVGYSPWGCRDMTEQLSILRTAHRHKKTKRP